MKIMASRRQPPMKIGDSLSNYLSPLTFCLRIGIISLGNLLRKRDDAPPKMAEAMVGPSHKTMEDDQGKVCLRCGRKEHEAGYTRCMDCGGILWTPENVGGKPGNRNMDEASRLIRAGRTPWREHG